MYLETHSDLCLNNLVFALYNYDTGDKATATKILVHHNLTYLQGGE